MTDATDLTAWAQGLLDGTTEGPWYWEETHPTNACANVMAKSEGGWSLDIATLYGSTDDVPTPTMPDEPWGDHPIRRANARLCAAAPDLARALIASEAARKLAEERLAKAVEALELAANRLSRRAVDYVPGSRLFIETGEWADEARAVIKEITE